MWCEGRRGRWRWTAGRRVARLRECCCCCCSKGGAWSRRREGRSRSGTAERGGWKGKVRGEDWASRTAGSRRGSQSRPATEMRLPLLLRCSSLVVGASPFDRPCSEQRQQAARTRPTRRRPHPPRAPASPSSPSPCSPPSSPSARQLKLLSPHPSRPSSIPVRRRPGGWRKVGRGSTIG